MEQKHNKLPPHLLRILAEGIAFVGIERPLLPGKSPKQSAQLLLAAYLKAHNPVSKVGSHHLERLQHLCDLPERCLELINHKEAFGTELADYETCLSLLTNN